MIRSARSHVSAVALTAFAFALSGCGEAALDTSTRASRESIVGGAPDASHPEVLLLYNDPQLGPCSATLVAPDLVLTARHCVSLETGDYLFCGNAGDPGVGFDLPVYGGDRQPSELSVSAVPDGPALAHGVQIFHDGANTTCRHDLALFQIDPPITEIEPAPIREEPALVGEMLTAAGWGFIDDDQTQTTEVLRSKQVEVLGIGPLTYAFHPYDDASSALQDQAVVDNELIVSFGTTAAGDSGGPAFDGDGAIVGTIARGYVTPSYGPSTLSAVHAHLPVIEQAFTAVGYRPGAGSGGSAGAGGGAGTGGESGTGGAGGHPNGASGGATSGGGGPPSGPQPAAGADDGGCAVRGVGHSSTAGAALAGLALALALVAARRRHPGCGDQPVSGRLA